MKCNHLHKENPQACTHCGHPIFVFHSTSDDLEAIRCASDDPVSPSKAVVNLIAGFQDVDPTELPPLSDSIDIDVLDQFTEDNHSMEISFQYAGFDVTVNPSSDVKVHSTGSSQGQTVQEIDSSDREDGEQTRDIDDARNEGGDVKWRTVSGSVPRYLP